MAVKDVTETIKTPREECQDVQVQTKAPVKDEHRIAGKLGGAVVGGALGSMVGSGRGKTVATVAGAVGGGYAGNKIQKNMQDKGRCHDHRTALQDGLRHLGKNRWLRRKLPLGRQAGHGTHGSQPGPANPRKGRSVWYSTDQVATK